MKWSIIGIDKKGIWVDWGYCDSYDGGNDGESYDLEMPPYWWQNKLKYVMEIWQYSRRFSFIVPSFLVYFLKPVSTIKLIISDIKFWIQRHREKREWENMKKKWGDNK